jgi:hypothetical protein
MGIMSGSGTYPSSSVFPDGSSFYPPEHQQQPIQQPQYGGGKVSHIQAMLIKKMQEEQAAMQQAQAYLQQQNAMQQTVTNNNQTPAPSMYHQILPFLSPLTQKTFCFILTPLWRGVQHVPAGPS